MTEEIKAPKENEVYWGALTPRAIIPTKRDEDAGYDMYAEDRETEVVVQPHETVGFLTGICSAFHSSKVAILKERGSTGKLGIGQRSGVVDSGYRGNWEIFLTNHNTKPIVFTPNPDKYAGDDTVIVYNLNKALCQAVFLEVPAVSSTEKSAEFIRSIPSKRGESRLGASGK